VGGEKREAGIENTLVAKESKCLGMRTQEQRRLFRMSSNRQKGLAGV
jgi:hypothetical protein